MRYTYPAVFVKESNGYSVIFPDLNVATDGSSLDEAVFMAMELLAISIDWLKEENEPLPAPSPMDSIDQKTVVDMDESEYIESFILPVTTDVDEYMALIDGKVKQIVSMQQELFYQSFDKDIELSEVLQEALINKLHSM